MNKKCKGMIALSLILSLFFTTGFTNFSSKPKNVYRVYVKGKTLGLVKSKRELEDYIDKKEEEIKKKYKVDKVYAPEDLDIVKEITFDDKIKSNQEIYEEIKDISPFTING